MEIDPAIQMTAAFAIAAILAASATMKFAAPGEFAGAVANYRLIPYPMAWPAAIAIPVVECGIALGLIISATRAGAALGAIAIFAAFSAAIAINLARGRVDIDCGCLGPAVKQKISWWLVARNFVLATAAALAAYPGNARAILAFDYFSAIAAGAALATIYAGANVIAANMPRTRKISLEFGDA